MGDSFTPQTVVASLPSSAPVTFTPGPPPSLPPSGIAQLPPTPPASSVKNWWILVGILVFLFIGIVGWYWWSLRP